MNEEVCGLGVMATREPAEASQFNPSRRAEGEGSEAGGGFRGGGGRR